MINIKNIIVIFSVSIALIACSQHKDGMASMNEEVVMSDLSSSEEETSVSEAKEESADNEINTLASVAVLQTDTTDFKLLTNVDVKFKTTKVTQTVPEIEKVLLANRGVILKSSIESYTVSDKRIGETVDSIRYQEEKNIQGAILVYVPKQEVYKVLEEIGAFATQIDSRTISSQDVTIDLLRASLSKKRGARKQQRIENLTATKPAKLNDAMDAEETLDNTLQGQDENKIKEFEIYRKLKYTLLSINVYQDSYYRTYSMPQQEEYSIGFKDRSVMALQFGWNMLSAVIFFFLNIWPITILLIVGIIFYFKKIRKKNNN